MPPSIAPAAGRPEIKRLADLSPQQWRSGIAAWLGWLFDGLDMHLYTLVATPFVAQLLALDEPLTLVDPDEAVRGAPGDRPEEFNFPG